MPVEADNPHTLAFLRVLDDGEIPDEVGETVLCVNNLSHAPQAARLALPGLGGAVFQAVRAQEGALVVGVTTFFIFVYIFFNLLVDVLYAALDPRIRYE